MTAWQVVRVQSEMDIAKAARHASAERVEESSHTSEIFVRYQKTDVGEPSCSPRKTSAGLPRF